MESTKIIKKPLISIITTVKNGEKHLEECIQSVLNQSYKNIQYIIIDGNSKDKTISIIQKYEKNLFAWESKDDNGIYDGFNRGLKIATGDLIGFINSDDIYCENALEILVKYYNQYPDVDFIFGSVKKHWGVLHGYKPWKINFSWGFYSSHSTGFFIKKKAADKLGLYNLKYKFSSDYDYFYRMIIKEKLKGVATKKNEMFGIFRRGGYSSSIKFIDHFFEEINIRLDNGQNKILVLLIFIYKFIKNIHRI